MRYKFDIKNKYKYFYYYRLPMLCLWNGYYISNRIYNDIKQIYDKDNNKYIGDIKYKFKRGGNT